MTFTAEALSDIRLQRSLSGKGFEGVSGSCFFCDIHTDIEIPEGAEIEFLSYSLPTFKITKSVIRNGVVSITAYDRTNDLNIPFDYSGYEQFDTDGTAKWYPSTMIVGAIANQCGFAVSGYSGRMSELCFLDFAGKTCRDILTELSRVDVGYWYQSSDNSLAFRAFSSPSDGFEIAPEKRSEIELRGSKTITGIYAEDTVYGTDYHTGSPWENTERLSGRYLSEAIVQDMAGQILSKGGQYVYYGWSCGAALVDSVNDIGDCVKYSGRLLPILSADYRFEGIGIIAALSAPDADNGLGEYTDLYSRMIEGTVPKDKSLGMQFFSDSSSGFRVEV